MVYKLSRDSFPMDRLIDYYYDHVWSTCPLTFPAWLAEQGITRTDADYMFFDDPAKLSWFKLKFY